MNAINHAATALVIKKYSPNTPIIPILISVQFVELLWVLFNLVGWERTEFSEEVNSLADIHLIHMPFSHSIAFSLIWVLLAYFVLSKVLKKPDWVLAVSVGILSHIVLDILTHAPDIEIIPFLNLPEIGTGLYQIPLYALVVELAFCVLCWYLYKGGLFMLIALLTLNIFSLSFYLPQLLGPEVLFAEYPFLFVPVIAVHILFGLGAVYLLHLREEKAGLSS